MNGAVLVLNQNYEPLNVCNLRRAILLVYDGKAEVIEANGRVVKSATQAFPAPSVPFSPMVFARGPCRSARDASFRRRT